MSEWRYDQGWHLHGLLDAQVDVVLNGSAVIFELLNLGLYFRERYGNKLVLSFLSLDLLLLVSSLLFEVVNV